MYASHPITSMFSCNHKQGHRVADTDWVTMSAVRYGPRWAVTLYCTTYMQCHFVSLHLPRVTSEPDGTSDGRLSGNPRGRWGVCSSPDSCVTSSDLMIDGWRERKGVPCFWNVLSQLPTSSRTQDVPAQSPFKLSSVFRVPVLSLPNT